MSINEANINKGYSPFGIRRGFFLHIPHSYDFGEEHHRSSSQVPQFVSFSNPQVSPSCFGLFSRKQILRVIISTCIY